MVTSWYYSSLDMNLSIPNTTCKLVYYMQCILNSYIDTNRRIWKCKYSEHNRGEVCTHSPLHSFPLLAIYSIGAGYKLPFQLVSFCLLHFGPRSPLLYPLGQAFKPQTNHTIIIIILCIITCIHEPSLPPQKKRTELAYNITHKYTHRHTHTQCIAFLFFNLVYFNFIYIWGRWLGKIPQWILIYLMWTPFRIMYRKKREKYLCGGMLAIFLCWTVSE